MNLPKRSPGPAGNRGPTDITGAGGSKATPVPVARSPARPAALRWRVPVPIHRAMAACGRRRFDMTLIRWEPFREMDDFFARYSPFFGRPPGGRAAVAAGEQPETAVWTPVANISETENEYLIKAELPEVRKEDVRVTVDEGVITISGERRHELEHKDEKVHRIESF